VTENTQGRMARAVRPFFLSRGARVSGRKFLNGGVKETDWLGYYRSRWQREDTLDPEGRFAAKEKIFRAISLPDLEKSTFHWVQRALEVRSRVLRRIQAATTPERKRQMLRLYNRITGKICKRQRKLNQLRRKLKAA
jgi:hypothetical protein